MKKIVNSMERLDDEIVIELLIRIINLMEYFCRVSQKLKSVNPLFDDVSDSLNDLEREAALFNCLAVPDDGVRLSVVKCLFVVPINDYETPEIEQVLSIMAKCQDISAGQTELVLSTIYWILTKFVLPKDEDEEDEADSSDGGEDITEVFKKQFGQKVIDDAIELLNRNLKRINETEEEDEEKYCLSISVLNFIKTCSNVPIMKPYFTGKNQIFKECLVHEELFSSDRINKLPIDIENTHIGRDMNCLLQTLIGIDSV